MSRLLRPRPCPQWTATITRRSRCPAPDSTFMLFRASPWSPQCPVNSPLCTLSATKGLSRPLFMYVCPWSGCLDKSEVYTRKPKGRLVLGQEIPYSTFKGPAQGERYAREFSLSQVSTASPVVLSACLPPTPNILNVALSHVPCAELIFHSSERNFPSLRNPSSRS